MTLALKTRSFVVRNDKIDAATAADAVSKALTAGSGFQYIASTKIWATDWDVAHAVGLARTTIAKAKSLNSSKYRRGAATDERIDTEGALGEWLTAGLLGPSGVDIAALVAYQPPKGEVDLLLNGARIDVKTMGQTCKRNCNINREQHFSKTPAGYLVVHLISADIADIYLVRAEELLVSKENGGKWALRHGFSPYYNAYLAKQLPTPEAEEAD